MQFSAFSFVIFSQSNHISLLHTTTASGIDAERALEERRLLAAQEVDLNDAAHNSTVREYETIRESSDAVATEKSANSSSGSDVEGSASKKSRRQ